MDVLVSNALIPYALTSFAELTWEQLGGKLDRELHAAFLLTKAVVPGMISRGYGRLIYLDTTLSRWPRDRMIALGVSKAALDQFVRYIALELAPHGITANLVSPATVEGTTMSQHLTRERCKSSLRPFRCGGSSVPRMWPWRWRSWRATTSGFTTGHSLPVNGGLAMD